MERSECIRRKICPVCQRTSTINYESCAYKINCEECGEYRITEDLVEDEFDSSEGTYNLEKLSLYLFHHKADARSNNIINMEIIFVDSIGGLTWE